MKGNNSSKVQMDSVAFDYMNKVVTEKLKAAHAAFSKSKFDKMDDKMTENVVDKDKLVMSEYRNKTVADRLKIAHEALNGIIEMNNGEKPVVTISHVAASARKVLKHHEFWHMKNGNRSNDDPLSNQYFFLLREYEKLVKSIESIQLMVVPTDDAD